MRQLHIVLLLVLTLFTFCAQAQETSSARNVENSDQFWLQFQVSKELPKNFTLGLQYRLKVENQFSQFRSGGIYGYVSYKVNKYLSTQVLYKYYTSRFKDEHTFFASLTTGYKYKDFKISLRGAYQRTYEYFSDRYQPGHEPINQWRNRLMLRYDVHKDWNVYISAEPYLLFDARSIMLQKIRASTGVNWNFAKYSTVNLFYTFQPKFDGKRPENEHILGLSFEVDLPKKFKKKKKGKGKDSNTAPSPKQESKPNTDF